MPDLDMADLAGTIAEADEFEQTQAVRAFRQKIRRRFGWGVIVTSRTGAA